MTDLLKRIGVPAAVLAIFAALPWLWMTADDLGVRPVLSREVVELTAVVDKTQDGVNLIQWQILDQRSKTEELSPRDKQLYCYLSKLLNFQGKGCA